MKKSTPRSRRHRNPKTKEQEQQPAFFSKANDTKVQTKEESNFFQPKLEISPANDPQEKEADAVANKVVHGVKQQKSASIQKKEKVNRMAEQEEKPKAKLQLMAEEEKADAKLQREAKDEEAKPKLQKKENEEEAAPKLQAKDAASEQKTDTKQKKKEASSSLEQMIKKSKGKGFALPFDVRTEMESQFNVDFSDVRIHTDMEAVEMCEMIRAQAFAHGFHIYFNEGKYNPDTDTGKNLLAHELTHVVQQKGG